MNTQTTTSALSILADHIRSFGPIKTVRVSSAQARGFAKRFNYWGAVRYEIRLGWHGQPTNVPLERARSRRRSLDLAFDDAAEIAEKEGRIYCERIGRLSEEDARDVLDKLGV
jgi:hypothetical protein